MAKMVSEEERLTLLNAREAAVYLHISLYTLGRIEAEGALVPFRTPGGHRHYSKRMLDEYLEWSRTGWKELREKKKQDVK